MNRLPFVVRRSDPVEAFIAALTALASADGHADAFPVVGVVEQIPVLADGIHVGARPIYVLADRKLSAPTVFSGLQGPGSTLDVLCCHEVENITSTSLDTELAEDGKDPVFASQLMSADLAGLTAAGRCAGVLAASRLTTPSATYYLALIKSGTGRQFVAIASVSANGNLKIEKTFSEDLNRADATRDVKTAKAALASRLQSHASLLPGAESAQPDNDTALAWISPR